MDLNEKIIEKVKQHDCLYNLQSTSYKNFQHKESLWIKIGSEIGVPAREVKKKWRNMRDTYKKYMKEVLTHGNENTIRKQYKYAENLRFLDDLPTSRMNMSNISESSIDITTDSCSDTDLMYFPPQKQRKPNAVKLEEKVKVEKLDEIMDAPSSSIANFTISSKSNVTVQLFECLANKINDCNLTMMQKNEIESSVCSLVYSKLAEYATEYPTNFY